MPHPPLCMTRVHNGLDVQVAGQDQDRPCWAQVWKIWWSMCTIINWTKGSPVFSFELKIPPPQDCFLNPPPPLPLAPVASCPSDLKRYLCASHIPCHAHTLSFVSQPSILNIFEACNKIYFWKPIIFSSLKWLIFKFTKSQKHWYSSKNTNIVTNIRRRICRSGLIVVACFVSLGCSKKRKWLARHWKVNPTLLKIRLKGKSFLN